MCENEKKLVRTQNVITFKPRYKKCPDFDSDAPPTPGHPGKKDLPRSGRIFSILGFLFNFQVVWPFWQISVIFCHFRKKYSERSNFLVPL